METDATQPRLAPALTVLTLARTVLNGARRFPYVILTPMAHALGVPRSTLEAALSLQWATGALSPIAGRTIERIGRKRVMLLGMGSMTLFAGIAALGFSPALILFAIVASGLSKTLYDPAMQAYIGDNTPYRLRGLAIGVTELSWSGALVIFAPLAAYLIVNVSLEAIFAVIAVGSAVTGVLVAVALPDDAARPKHADPPSFVALWRSRPALAMLAAGLLIALASEAMTITYEAWLLDTFLLSTAALGLLSWAISAAEVTGEGFVIAVADRFGKRRLALISLVGTGIAYAVLPLTSGSLPAAVLALFAMFLMFEISIVVLIPMATETLPTARGLMMTSNVAALAFGRAIGAIAGGIMYRSSGYEINGIAGLVLNLIAALLIARFTVE
ncbi:MAG TPA: MFS transporter [Aggregatilineales bacterium]|nr:MFS transporter [Aggregatilineales bacterium]